MSVMLLGSGGANRAGTDDDRVEIYLTGKEKILNGQAEVAPGLFGIHHAPRMTAQDAADWGVEAVRVIHQNPADRPTRPGQHPRVPEGIRQVVDCWFDRYQPALPLTDRNWAERLGKLARAYAANASRDPDRPDFLEFWNEPYLNWATKPGVNYAPDLYETRRIKAGDPMVLKATGRAVEGLVWDRQIFFVLQPDGKSLNHVLSSYIPRDASPGQEVTLGYGAGKARLEDGGTVRLRGQDHRVAYLWSGKDPDQQFYWSGPVNVRLYNQMLAVLGPAIKETNPHVQLAAGWGFNFYNENWESWRRLIRPTIDASHAWIDALHEHHYGGDTRRVAASYEVAYAYTLARYGKRLAFWNTEAGGYLDPQQPGNSRSQAPSDPEVRARQSMTYLLRDLAYLLRHMPDKARHRAAHEPDQNGGDIPALQLLKPLRGRLLEIEGGHAQLQVAAARSGKRVAILVYNDARETRRFRLNLQAPAGTRWQGAAVRRWIETGSRPSGLHVAEREMTFPASAPVIEDELSSQEAVVWTVELDSEPAVAERSVWWQFVSADVLVPLDGSEVNTTVSVPSAVLGSSARRARLRLVTESSRDARWKIRFNDKELVKNQEAPCLIWDLDLPPEALRVENRIEFQARGGSATVLATSLWLQTDDLAADPLTEAR